LTNFYTMHHSEHFLRRLAKDEVVGAFYPFDSGEVHQVEDYIRQIITKIKKNKKIIVDADFSYYGSGFASYIPVNVSKADYSDSQISKDKNRLTKLTNGILLYISNLTPYWYYGAAEWSTTTENNVFKSGSRGFLKPQDIDLLDQSVWGAEIKKITEILGDFGYSLARREDMEEILDFDLDIPGNLVGKQRKIFDCFFHWQD